MRKVSTFIGLTLIALGTGARAEDSVPASPPAAADPAVAVSPAPEPAATVVAPVASFARYSPRRLELGLAALVMGLGNVTNYDGVATKTHEGTVVYGASLSLGYRVIAGLSVGIAPQVIFGVNAKDSDAASSTEYNFMGRVAYTLPLIEGLSVYAEALPGYSMKSGSRWAKGFVLAVGGGVMLDLTDRAFANIGAGYQLGYQNLALGAGAVYPNREDYVRVAVGGGVRF
ncbi:MAG TPA: hypothetical protein VN962_03085 [Polyangia bacterium]|nr:hypothetical protein [Polyangia bacterium]